MSDSPIGPISFRPNVPPGLQKLLKDLSVEVLRQQPVDVTKFAADYFQKILRKREIDLNGRVLKMVTKGAPMESGDKSNEPSPDKMKILFEMSTDAEDDDVTLPDNSIIYQSDNEDESVIPSVTTGLTNLSSGFFIVGEFSPPITPDAKHDANTKVSNWVNSHDDIPGQTDGDGIDIDLNDPEVQQAALKIQRTFKIHLHKKPKAKTICKPTKEKTETNKEKSRKTSTQIKADIVKEIVNDQDVIDDEPP
ncbi:unnamed protein product, partial [Owenia fusiformis]